MKKEFEPGNVKEIIDSIQSGTWKKRMISTKKLTGWKGACISYADIWGDAELYPERVYTGADIVELLDAVIHGRGVRCVTITNHIEINGTVRDFETLTRRTRRNSCSACLTPFHGGSRIQRMKGEPDEKGNRGIQPQKEARLEMQLRRRTEELNENLRFQGLLYETIFVLTVLLIATVFALLVVTSNRFL